jgi:DNA-binding response OmpR family regulator
VVEDDAEVAATLALVLQRAGHAVCLAADGNLALTEAPRFIPEVVILDLRLPTLDGHEVAKQLRAMPWARRPLLIGVTGYSDELDKLRPSSEGVDVSIRKPTDFDELLGLLSRWSETVRREP